MTLQALVQAINRIRLEENRSYAALALEIGVDPGALYKILNRQSDPYDRTLHKLERYIDRRRPVPMRRRKVSV